MTILPLCSRGAIFWPLLRSCVLITVGLMLTLYFFHLIVARGIFVSVRLHRLLARCI